MKKNEFDKFKMGELLVVTIKDGDNEKEEWVVIFNHIDKEANPILLWENAAATLFDGYAGIHPGDDTGYLSLEGFVSVTRATPDQIDEFEKLLNEYGYSYDPALRLLTPIITLP